jgi:hypothetical protein
MIAMMVVARGRKGRANEKVDGRVCCLDLENQIRGREMATLEEKCVATVQMRGHDLRN